MSDFPALHPLGYSPRWQALFSQFEGADTYPARVVRADRGSVLLATPDGLSRAKPSPALVKAACGQIDLPAIGDWVAVHAPDGIDLPLIETVLPRTSAITRGDPGASSDVQMLAANVDTVFLVHPIDAEPNLRRIERELSLVWDSGAVPVIVLTKADASAGSDDALAAVEAVAIGCDVLVTSAVTGIGVDLLPLYVEDRRTAVLLGPSGAGKSTLINALLGEERQETGAVRLSDRRGRHTTVVRELIQLPGGGILIDTPGLRALALTGSGDGPAMVLRDHASRPDPNTSPRSRASVKSISPLPLRRRAPSLPEGGIGRAMPRCAALRGECTSRTRVSLHAQASRGSPVARIPSA